MKQTEVRMDFVVWGYPAGIDMKLVYEINIAFFL